MKILKGRKAITTSLTALLFVGGIAQAQSDAGRLGRKHTPYWRSGKGGIRLKSVILLLIVCAPLWAVADDATAAGKDVYSQTCIACHGAKGKGMIPGVRDLTDPDGALTKSDEELIENISNGMQSPGSFMAMPAKGGNPALSEDDIKAVLAYIRVEFGK